MSIKINLSQIEVNRNYDYFFDKLSIKDFMLLDLKKKNCIIKVYQIEIDRFEIIEGHQIFRLLKNLEEDKVLVDYKIEVLKNLTEIEMTKLFINDELKIRKTKGVSYSKVERLVNWKNRYEGKGKKQIKKPQPILAKELGITYDKFGRYSQLKPFYKGIKKILDNRINPRILYSIFKEVPYDTQREFSKNINLKNLTDKKSIDFALKKFLDSPEKEIIEEIFPEKIKNIKMPPKKNTLEKNLEMDKRKEIEFKMREKILKKENEKLLQLNKKLEKEKENILISNSRNAVADMLAQIGTTLEDLGKIKKIFAIINTKKSFIKPQYVDKHNEIIDEIIREAKTLKIEDYTEDVMIVE